MPERDFRLRCDLCFPPEHEGVARGLINHLFNQIDKTVKIGDGEITGERGYCSLERCGHRIGESCEVIENHDVE